MQLSCAVPLALLDRDGLMLGQADTLIKQASDTSPASGRWGTRRPRRSPGF